jgi:hypothetical protein
LEDRVTRAAEAALADHHYVSAIDVLCGMGALTPAQLQLWRQGRVDYLERVVQGNLSKTSDAMSVFRKWAEAKGLKPSETQYVRRTRSETLPLRFSAGGNADIERAYRTHYVSPALSEAKRQRLQEKLDTAPRTVVFLILRDSKCSECGAELERGSFLTMEGEQPLCVPCARLDELEYLPAGDVALTRRATKYSARTAVVVEFSRSRGRYERQGILVELAALERAEQECASDAEERARRRQSAAAARVAADRKLVARMTERIRALFPGCPIREAVEIAEHTARRGSGRVGRSAAGRNLEEEALWLAVAAAVRHRHTRYDELLLGGLDRAMARLQVRERVDEVLAEWRAPA